MKIVNIVPGFGGTFYCGNCLRDSSFAMSLREAGHKAVMLPMYLPLTLQHGRTNPDIPVFYGAVNIYLKQQFPVMRNMPGWMERFFNSTPILKLAARKSGSTRASGLESLTESMLLGSEGNQKHELEQLIDYLKHHEKPDIVHFSNALLLGLAGQVREELNIPVVCSLQDEDVWVDAMEEVHRDHMWNLLSDKAKDVDAFIAVSNYFGRLMQEKMKIDPDKIHTVPIGVSPGNYKYAPRMISPATIGYLSRINEENGFGLLVDAFIRLAKTGRFNDTNILATGGYTGDDKKFIQAQFRKLKNNGLSDRVRIMEDFSPESLKHFFREITLLTVPVLKGEAFGLYQLEALASGIPLVQPEVGAFPEIISGTGGGWLYKPNTAEALAQKWAEVLSDPAALEHAGKNGHEAVETLYHSGKLAFKMINIYEEVLSKRIRL